MLVGCALYILVFVFVRLRVWTADLGLGGFWFARWLDAIFRFVLFALWRLLRF